MNRIVRQYGGNSYYISPSRDLSTIIREDFSFYQRPAVSDLLVSVHALGPSPQQSPVRTYTQRSMGPDEHHTFLVQMKVPSQIDYLDMLHKKGEEEKPQVPESYPLAFVTYQYYSHAKEKMEYGSEKISVVYGMDYAEYRLSVNPRVVKNMAILSTARLLEETAARLQSRDFERAIISIRNHVKTLEKVYRTMNDPLISEDIDTLNRYKALIAEQKRNPDRSLKIFLELRRRRY
ncbi:MAG: hypothetical protein ACOC7U_00630 [Spirochaetota bacterium]